MILLLLLLGSSIMIGKIEGIVGPITASYVTRTIQKAEDEKAEVLIFLIDTPGGLDEAMRDIIKEELNASIPIVIYVHPSGARDASAGVFITLAAHIAAMTPGTNIGAAHPVAIGPGGRGGDEEQGIDETMKEKMTQDAAAYIRSIAEKKNRNVNWAEDAVRKSASATAEEALKLGIIDVIAESVDELLEKIDGMEVELVGFTKKLNTKDAVKKEIPMTWREEFLKIISNPNIAYILFILGFYGLIFEITHPGAIIPGLLGALFLVLAFFAFQTLPINYTGVGLIILGIAMFVMEVLTPTYGPLTLGGIVAMTLGSLMLLNTNVPFLQISKSIIIAAVGTTAAFFLFALGAVIKAMKRKPATGKEGLIGEIGTAEGDINSTEGKVFIHGEYWNAESSETIKEGEKVEVLEVERLKLKVKKKEE
ncbi:nodulation protein NfeD [candidate division WOR-3 bacterium]|nr:nodulation protein NfeD [candidate division WOR-3 bacterium]